MTDYDARRKLQRMVGNSGASRFGGLYTHHSNWLQNRQKTHNPAPKPTNLIDNTKE